MSQEWDIDYKPSKNVSYRRFERVVDHETPKKKTVWRWYLGQMRGNGSYLYKMLVSLLVFTLWALIIGLIAGLTFVGTWAIQMVLLGK